MGYSSEEELSIEKAPLKDDLFKTDVLDTAQVKNTRNSHSPIRSTLKSQDGRSGSLLLMDVRKSLNRVRDTSGSRDGLSDSDIRGSLTLMKAQLKAMAESSNLRLTETD